MSKIGTFVVADERIVHEPWNVDMFAVVRFKTMLENGILTRLGYVVANTYGVEDLDSGAIQEMVFCSKVGKPLVCGPIYDGLRMLESDFGAETVTSLFGEPFNFQAAFSREQKLVLHELATSVHDRWLISTSGIYFGSFDLNMLPMMDIAETAGVPHFHYLDDDSWVELSNDLCEGGVAFWADWLPRIGAKVREGLEVLDRMEGTSLTYTH